MLNRKSIMLVIVFGIFLIVIFSLTVKKDKKINQDEKIQNEEIKLNSNYDENTSLYYIEDEKSGEIISISRDEKDLEFYESHPDYNPNPLSSSQKDLNSYLP